MGEVSLSRPKAHGSLTFASLLLKAVGLLAGIGLSVIGTSEILTPPAQYSAGCATPGLECQTFTQISPYLPFSLLLTGSVLIFLVVFFSVIWPLPRLSEPESTLRDPRLP